MIFTYSDGIRKKNLRNMDDVVFHQIVSCGTKETKTVESVTISCGDAGSAITLVVTDKDGNDFPILSAKAIAANDTYVMHQQNYPLVQGESIRAKADTADQLTVIIITIDAVVVQQNSNGRGPQWGA